MQFCVGLPFLPHSPALALTFAGYPSDGYPPQVTPPCSFPFRCTRLKPEHHPVFIQRLPMPRDKARQSVLAENRKTTGASVLIVDDNPDLLHFLTRLMADCGWTLFTADSATEAKRLVQEGGIRPDAALLDYMLPDGNGVELGVEFLQSMPKMRVIIMTGTILPPEEEGLCEDHDLPVLRKPFLASDVMNQIRTRLSLDIPGRARRIASPTASETPQKRALRVVFSYSHKDEKLRDRLDAHLAPLRHMGIIHSWHDRKITAGSHVDEGIDAQFEKADLILLLISSDFLNSEYCYRKEMVNALQRHAEGKARVIPVILRPVDWEKSPFAHLMAVPSDGRPITRWTNRDLAFLNVAKEIRRAAEELSGTLHSPR